MESLAYNNQPTLVGKSNFQEWFVDVKIACRAHGVWQLVTGKEQPVGLRPEPPKYPAYFTKFNQMDYMMQVERYKIAMNDYEFNWTRLKQARALLLDHLAPGIRASVSRDLDPHAIMRAIHLYLKV